MKVQERKINTNYSNFGMSHLTKNEGEHILDLEDYKI